MRENRLAVSALFFVNGFVFANWTSRLPEIQRFLSLSNSDLGNLLLVAALGALTAMPFTGWLTTKMGTKKIILFTGLTFCLFVSLIPIYPNIYLVGLILYCTGLSTGAMDVAMNGQAVLVERKYGKAIMSSFHAIFSIGMAIGAGVGAIFARFDIALLMHLMAMASLSATVLIFSYRYLIQDGPEEKSEDGKDEGFRLPTKAILPLGIISFCGMIGEGAMSDWSAIFMSKVVGRTDFESAIGFGVFAVAMTLGRFIGDWLTDQLGKRNLLIIDSILAFVGLGLTLFFASFEWALLGYFIIGIGLSTVVPIVYSTAGNTPGVSPSVGIAMATTIGYSGFFVGPPLIGYLGDAFGLRMALLLVLALFLIMLVLVGIYIPSQENENAPNHSVDQTIS
ncbi:MAG: MFS transporter [Bacteroidota bacterium]